MQENLGLSFVSAAVPHGIIIKLPTVTFLNAFRINDF